VSALRTPAPCTSSRTGHAALSSPGSAWREMSRCVTSVTHPEILARMSTLPEVATTPEVLEREFSLLTAVTRLDFLSRRDNVVIDEPNDSTDDDDHWMRIKDVTTTLDVEEALELLTLGEVVARKAHEHRQLGIRAALRGGADWEQIGRALGVSPRSAWERHVSWLDEQVRARAAGDPDALDAESLAAARTLAGRRP
jgi:hypothetical protein